jgi:DNA repair protein RadB
MEQDSRNKISAGSYDINKWLSGGYDRDIITTIYGPSGSGKTNLCLIAAASQARKEKKVIFIDTEGGFSVERFKQITHNEEWQKQLENILILKPTSFEEQWNSFSQLLKEIKADNENKIGLIVVDGMTMLYRLELAEARRAKENSEELIAEINSKLAKQLRILAEISRKRNIPILITNQVYSEFLTDEELKSGKQRSSLMVGGDILKYWSKCLIEIRNDKSKRKLVLRKHRNLAEKELEFEITNEGIKRKGWI